MCIYMCVCVYVCVCVCIYIYIYIYIEREREGERERERRREEIYYMELSHAIMGTEKFQDLPPASWRPRKTNGVVPAQVQRPETQES